MKKVKNKRVNKIIILSLLFVTVVLLAFHFFNRKFEWDAQDGFYKCGAVPMGIFEDLPRNSGFMWSPDCKFVLVSVYVSCVGYCGGPGEFTEEYEPEERNNNEGGIWIYDMGKKERYQILSDNGAGLSNWISKYKIVLRKSDGGLVIYNLRNGELNKYSR